MKLPQIYISVQKFNCCSKVKHGVQAETYDEDAPFGDAHVQPGVCPDAVDAAADCEIEARSPSREAHRQAQDKAH